MRRSVFLLLLAGSAFTADLTLPLKQKSVRFAVIGDSGTGERAQYEVGQQMGKYREKFPFDFVVMLGDNMYGVESPADFRRKLENHHKARLSGGWNVNEYLR